MSIDKRAYWLWLQHAFGASSSKPKTLYNRFNGDIKSFYEGGAPLWAQFQFLTEREISALYDFTLDHAMAALNYAESLGQKVITPECKEYPKLLWEIKDPPAVLYVKGNIPDIDNCLTIGIVGSRDVDNDIFKITEQIAYELSKAGIIVISGGAKGTDTAAHKGALMGVSPTICILGCGLDVQYLAQNEHLRKQILDNNGALITEYSPGTNIQRGTFQQRNRIISGLSRGVLISSAKQKSGSMITVKRATEQNRDIFAIPGNPADPRSYGPNSLIKDGAVPVISAEDIINEYNYTFNIKTNIDVRNEINELSDLNEINDTSTANNSDYSEAQDNNIDVLVSENARKVLLSLSYEPLHISEICAKSGLRSSLVSAAMTELELAGLATDYSGKRYALKK